MSSSRPYHVAISQETRSLIAVTDHFLQVWDLATGKERGRWPLPIPGNFVYNFAVSADGNKSITIFADRTALVWDTSRTALPGVQLSRNATAPMIAAWWEDLASEDAHRAYQAIWRLVEVPGKTTVAFLGQHLKPAARDAAPEISRLIIELDSDSFALREKATSRLKNLGQAALPAIRQALATKPSPEARQRLRSLLPPQSGLIPTPEELRSLRAIQVAELIGSKEAIELLDDLAKGKGSALQTREAKAAWERLTGRPARGAPP